ncbi:MAG: DUF1343 domain-containing protein [Verrucomicrobiales bacterium]|nr:DUF1343 domain-containing protein [Verrucomicrobiales bacterium]
MSLRLSAACLILAGAIAWPAGAFDPAKLKAIDRAIGDAIDRGEIPGAVFRLEHRGEVYEKAYGHRSLLPEKEPMTADTIFDAASLTKVLATAPSVSLLADRGRLDLDAPVVSLLPEFAPKGELRPLFRDKFDTRADTVAHRALVTVRQLLTHCSGLPPSISTQDEPWWGHRNGVRRCLTAPLIARPGTAFRYSDINYILLGEIVRRVSGRPVDAFAAEEIFAPLGMSDTGYRPATHLGARLAPTEALGAYGVIRGEVHDPTARRMEGVAGHAGLFTTAADVARYAAAFLPGAGSPVFRPELAAEMTRVQSPETLPARRGLGWDIDSAFSYQRGEVFPVGGFGHTGWTGTSIWVDPGSATVVVLLANRNHPSESGKIKELRIRVGTLAAEAVGLKPRAGSQAAAFRSDPVSSPIQQGTIGNRTAAGDPAGPVKNGIDVLADADFAPLRGLTIGLITNHTGIDREGRSTIDRLHGAPGVKVRALFAPEHGIRGTLDQAKIDDGTDERTGLPVYSLYKNETRAPSPAQLEGLDALVFDIQDIGCRFYTYLSTMGNAMEVAAREGKRFFVLDRVNPIDGIAVDGPVREGEASFTAWHPIPVRHGMTAGEMARLFAAERRMKLDLTVIPLEGWSRAMRFGDTGLPWVNPSPNMRNATAALLYPGIGLLEFCALSVGRGTERPFELIGAPYIDEKALAADLEAAELKGLRFEPVRFTPGASVFAGESCGGVRIVVTDAAACNPLDLGMVLAVALQKRYAGHLKLREKYPTLLKHPATLEAVAAGKSVAEIRRLWEPALQDFRQRRAAFLAYE